MDRLISEQKAIEAINDYWGEMETPTIDGYINAIKAIPSAEPTYYPPCEDCNTKMNKIRKAYNKVSAYKEMTNGEVLKTIFPDAECDFKKFCEEDTVVFNLNGFYMRVSADWWNSPYSEGSD